MTLNGLKHILAPFFSFLDNRSWSGDGMGLICHNLQLSKLCPSLWLITVCVSVCNIFEFLTRSCLDLQVSDQSLGSLSTDSQQSLNRLSTVSQQSLNSLSTVSQQSLNSLSTVSKQSLNSLSTVSQQSLNSLSTVSQQSLNSLSTVFLLALS